MDLKDALIYKSIFGGGNGGDSGGVSHSVTNGELVFNLFTPPNAESSEHLKGTLPDGTVLYCVTQATPQWGIFNYLLANDIAVQLISNDNFIVNENIYGYVDSDGALMFMCIAEGGALTPEMTGLPGYGFWVAEKHNEKTITILSIIPV